MRRTAMRSLPAGRGLGCPPNERRYEEKFNA
jgi:hypothetical protein